MSPDEYGDAIAEINQELARALPLWAPYIPFSIVGLLTCLLLLLYFAGVTLWQVMVLVFAIWLLVAIVTLAVFVVYFVVRRMSIEALSLSLPASVAEESADTECYCTRSLAPVSVREERRSSRSQVRITRNTLPRRASIAPHECTLGTTVPRTPSPSRCSYSPKTTASTVVCVCGEAQATGRGAG